MEEIAIKSGLKFIVNVVLGRGGGIAAAVAGDVVRAHRAGVQIAQPIYTVEVSNRTDIVVAGSHPADRDLWQGFKPLTNCGMLVKDGGTLILVIPAPEGISHDHPELVQLGQTPADAVLEMLNRGAIANEVAAATYLALDQTRRRIHITLVGDGIQAAEAGQIGLAATPSLEHALEMALARHGKDASIGVVTHGADFIGRVRAY
jgi:nickel-dependent lactate racemase